MSFLSKRTQFYFANAISEAALRPYIGFNSTSAQAAQKDKNWKYWCNFK